MQFSNDGSTRSPREPFATSQPRTLSPAYGTKTVYAQFDTDGDTGTVEVSTSDTINYINITSSTPPVAGG